MYDSEDSPLWMLSTACFSLNQCYLAEKNNCNLATTAISQISLGSLGPFFPIVMLGNADLTVLIFINSK